MITPEPLPLLVPLKCGYASVPMGMGLEHFDLLISTLNLWRPLLIREENAPDYEI